MIVYHGSSHNFKKLRISPKLSKQSSLENYGAGIYFSLDRSVASQYGRYLYTISIPDEVFVDFRSYLQCETLVAMFCRDFYKKFGIFAENCFNVESMAHGLALGVLNIRSIGNEIGLLLNNNEWFYSLFSSSRNEYMLNWCRNWKGVPSAFCFPCDIDGCGIITDLYGVEIINKEDLK